MAGKNHAKGERQAHLKLDEFYQSFFDFRDPHPFMTYFGTDKATATRIWNREQEAPKPNQLYRDCVNIGGRGSGKTYIALYTALRLSTDWEDNLGIIVRRHWNELHNSIILDFKRVLEFVTDGHPDYLVEGPDRKEGFYEAIVFTRGKPSTIIIKPEPEKSSDREVEDAFKGPQYGWFLCDELSQLKRITLSTLQDNLRRPNIPELAWRGMGMSNPSTKGKWLYEFAREHELAESQGKRPDVIIARSRMEDNPFLPPGYIQRMKNKYMNDPIKYAMYVEGRDGIEIEGTPVFKGAFSTSKNVGTVPHRPLSRVIVGMDFGWNRAAAVFLQFGDRGFINVIGELLCEHMTVERFGRAIKDYIKLNFPGCPVNQAEYFCDPAGVQHQDTSGKTAINILRRKCGIDAKWSKVPREIGIDTIREVLTDYGIDTERPRMMFDDALCHDLITGMIGGYRWKESAGVVKPVPYPDGYFIHYMDALRYAIQNIVSPHRDHDETYDEPIFARGMTPRTKRYGD